MRFTADGRQTCWMRVTASCVPSGVRISRSTHSVVIAYIGIGSNLGDRQRYLESGVEALSRLGPVLAISSVYETEPIGVDSPQPPFLNMVVAVEACSAPSDLLESLLATERDNHRASHERNAARTLDLDILTYGDLVVDRPRLKIPHPRLHERAFVLTPLAEIAPDFLHPKTGASVTEMLDSIKCQRVERLGELAE